MSRWKLADCSFNFFQVSGSWLSCEEVNPIRHDSWIIPHYIFDFDFSQSHFFVPILRSAIHLFFQTLISTSYDYTDRINLAEKVDYLPQNTEQRNGGGDELISRALHKLLQTKDTAAN